MTHRDIHDRLLPPTPCRVVVRYKGAAPDVLLLPSLALACAAADRIRGFGLWDVSVAPVEEPDECECEVKVRIAE